MIHPLSRLANQIQCLQYFRTSNEIFKMMIMMMLAVKFSMLVTTLNLLAADTKLVLAIDKFYQEPEVTAADILKGRGYIADELFVETSTGYVLRVTRGRNPLIDGGHLASKDPILFLHGAMSSANNFLLNSFGARPKDFTNISLVSMDLDALQERLADEPSAKSLPLLALNCGHEVWLLDRRGVPGSQQLIGDPISIEATPSGQDTSFFGNIMDYLSNMVSEPLFAREVVFTLDRKFWNYSLDDQAKDDFPATIAFILDHSPGASRVAVVAHSSSGAIALMGLSLYPEELTRKISSCILWAPSFAMGNDDSLFGLILKSVLDVLEIYIGPIPAPFLTVPIQAISKLVCYLPAAWTTTCESSLDVLFGDSGGLQPARPELLKFMPYSTASHEFAQVGQISRYVNKTMHAYDYGEDGNQAIYGQSTPPRYELSLLGNYSALSFYLGFTDDVTRPADIDATRKLLRGSSEYHLIDVPFNHYGFFFHVNVSRLAIIPSMWEIENLPSAN